MAGQFPRLKAIVGVSVLLLSTSCKTVDPESAALDDQSQFAVAQPKMCAAVRGNGHYIFSHFGSLARITEEFGLIDGMAGGSSASITAFLYESILMNPNVQGLDEADQRIRVATLLKSLLGYMQAVGASDEGLAVQALAVLSKKMQAQGIFDLPEEDYLTMAVELRKVLKDPGVRALVNPRIFEMLQDSDNMGYKSYQYKVNEIREAARVIGGFNAKDNRIFFREGIINFDGLAGMVNRVANFYAGLGPYNSGEMESFLSLCATRETSLGKNWQQLAEVPVNGQTCGARFKVLVDNYRQSFQNEGYQSNENRLEHNIGRRLTSVIASSVISGEAAINDVIEGRKFYRKNPGEQVPFKLDFNAVRFGYWMAPAVRSRFEKAVYQGDYKNDPKMQRYLSLNGAQEVSWKQVLRYSPMEPGLAPISIVSGAFAYAGGWSDLFPVQALKAVGCQEVIYVTRRGPETSFVTKPRSLEGVADEERYGVAELLGLQAPDQNSIYSYYNADSSYRRAIRDADGVWCTSWDDAPNFDFNYMVNHTYDTKGNEWGYQGDGMLVANSDFFKAGYTQRHISQKLVGCKE